jgi:hypothetical protein
MNEIWKAVPGYAGCYEVSDQGRVRSIDRDVTWGGGCKRSARGRVRKLTPSARGDKAVYLTVTLSKESRIACRYVHRLVAEAFLGPCPDGQEVCHGPIGTLDNSISNLRYGTHGSNELDKQRDGTSRCRPVRNSNGEVFPSLVNAGRATNSSPQKIWAVCNGLRQSTKDLKWEYI